MYSEEYTGGAILPNTSRWQCVITNKTVPIFAMISYILDIVDFITIFVANVSISTVGCKSAVKTISFKPGQVAQLKKKHRLFQTLIANLVKLI